MTSTNGFVARSPNEFVTVVYRGRDATAPYFLRGSSRLTDLGQKMNQATGDQKIQAMEAVLSEMINQRNAMRDMMMSHHASMMEHMGEHMQKGASPMMQCPMMKEMEKEKKENEEHKEHHSQQ